MSREQSRSIIGGVRSESYSKPVMYHCMVRWGDDSVASRWIEAWGLGWLGKSPPLPLSHPWDSTTEYAIIRAVSYHATTTRTNNASALTKGDVTDVAKRVGKSSYPRRGLVRSTSATCPARQLFSVPSLFLANHSSFGNRNISLTIS